MAILPSSTAGSCLEVLIASCTQSTHRSTRSTTLRVMETLRGQVATVERPRLPSDGKPIIVSPVTLKPRFNTDATGSQPPLRPEELPPQVDPRQNALFGAAWTLGSISNLAYAGASSLTYYETTGWKGVMETESGSTLPERFPIAARVCFPDVSRVRGYRRNGWRRAPLRDLPALPSGGGCDARERRNRRSLIANLRAERLSLSIRGLGRRSRALQLDETNVESACRFPDVLSAPTRIGN